MTKGRIGRSGLFSGWVHFFEKEPIDNKHFFAAGWLDHLRGGG
jgi:hypothetical protein